jgi:hypothetical protein
MSNVLKPPAAYERVWRRTERLSSIGVPTEPDVRILNAWPSEMARAVKQGKAAPMRDERKRKPCRYALTPRGLAGYRRYKATRTTTAD